MAYSVLGVIGIIAKKDLGNVTTFPQQKSALLLGDDGTQMLKGWSAEVLAKREKGFNFKVNSLFASLTYFWLLDCEATVQVSAPSLCYSQWTTHFLKLPVSMVKHRAGYPLHRGGENAESQAFPSLTTIFHAAEPSARETHAQLVPQQTSDHWPKQLWTLVPDLLLLLWDGRHARWPSLACGWT